MQNTSKTALLSIFAAVLIVGTGTAAYLTTDYPHFSKADAQPTSITTTSSAITLPEAGLTVQETLRISDDVQIVSAFSPLTEGTFSTKLSLWRIDASKNTTEKIHEFTSGIPAGLLTKIERGYSRKEYVYTIEESWEGYRQTEKIILEQDGQVAAIISQPSAIEFTIKSKGESITVKPYGDLCHNQAFSATTSQTVVRTLAVNTEGFALKEPYTLNCEFSEMSGVHTGTVFDEIYLSEPDYYGDRHTYVNLYGSKQDLILTLKKSGLVNIKQ